MCLHVQEWKEVESGVTARGLLAELGLPSDAVLNILTIAKIPTPSYTTPAMSAAAAARTKAGASSSAGTGSKQGLVGAAKVGALEAAASVARAAAARLLQGRLGISLPPAGPPSTWPNPLAGGNGGAVKPGAGKTAGAQPEPALFKLVGEVRQQG